MHKGGFKHTKKNTFIERKPDFNSMKTNRLHEAFRRFVYRRRMSVESAKGTQLTN